MKALQADEIKNAIAARLLEVAPDCDVYREAVTKPSYPHFFVHLINVTDEEGRKKRHILTYSFDLRYRVRSDPSTDLRLNSDLDAMALKLMVGFNIIDCNDVKIRCEDKHYEKTDGVLHFFCEIKIQALLVNLSDKTTKMNKITVEIRGKNG